MERFWYFRMVCFQHLRELTAEDEVPLGPCPRLVVEQFPKDFEGEVAVGEPPHLVQELVREDG